MVQSMKAGSVIIDVAVDQGGGVETMRITTHSEPVFVEEGVLHCGIANLPGGVPRTATIALSNATFPYVLQLANRGWEEACRTDRGPRTQYHPGEGHSPRRRRCDGCGFSSIGL
jgi:alanine dehydrogenase